MRAPSGRYLGDEGAAEAGSARGRQHAGSSSRHRGRAERTCPVEQREAGARPGTGGGGRWRGRRRPPCSLVDGHEAGGGRLCPPPGPGPGRRRARSAWPHAGASGGVERRAGMAAEGDAATGAAAAGLDLGPEGRTRPPGHWGTGRVVAVRGRAWRPCSTAVASRRCERGCGGEMVERAPAAVVGQARDRGVGGWPRRPRRIASGPPGEHARGPDLLGGSSGPSGGGAPVPARAGVCRPWPASGGGPSRTPRQWAGGPPGQSPSRVAKQR